MNDKPAFQLPPRVFHPHKNEPQPPENAPIARIGSGTRFWNHERPAPPLDSLATNEELEAALIKYQRHYLNLQTAPHLGLAGHWLECNCDGRFCHGQFMREAARTQLDYWEIMDLREREERAARRSQTEPQNAAKTPQQRQTAPPSKPQPSAAPKRPKPQLKPQADQRPTKQPGKQPGKQPTKPQEGREYLPRVQMSQRAGVSLRTLDYYKAQGLVTSWYVKGKNRVLFDVAKTLEQINAL